MEGTVHISIEEYDELRELNRELEKGKVLVKKFYTLADIVTYKYFTDNELVEKFIGEKDSLSKENKVLKNENRELSDTIEIAKETIEDITKMSCREFRKWKKK